MAVNGNARDDVGKLARELKDKIKLVQALSNYHIEHGTVANEADLHNQRTQIRKCIKEIEQDFSHVVALWHKSAAGGQARVAYDLDKGVPADLVTKFIKFAVPTSMQSVWDPETFTGSLLIFFENGKIESSSLVEKKIRPVAADEFPAGGEAEVETEKPVKIVQHREEFVAVLKSFISPKINIYFYLSAPATVVIKLYDQQDRLVRYLDRTYDEPGDYSVEWDGRDDDGEPLPKDTYYCQLEIGGTLLDLKTIELT